MTTDPSRQALRWRLLLGATAEAPLGRTLTGEDADRDRALAWLYERRREGEGDGGEEDDRLTRTGGDGPSTLSVPAWINEVHRLFPKEICTRIERDAIEAYGIQEIVTDPDVLARLTPDEGLLRAVLQTKHLMNPEVLALARALVARVVRDLLKALRARYQQALSGARFGRRSRRPIARNFDAKATIARNLHRWDPERRRLIVEAPRFRERTRATTDPWTIVLLVDQSGSMVSSVIHAAVTAACLWSLPGVKTHLVAFDTSVVDLTDHAADPVELLMKVQLGGGTDIGLAVQYAATKVTAPRRTIVVLISDLYEGPSEHTLLAATRRLVEQGVRFVALAALDGSAAPAFNPALAERLAALGASVGCMTPGQLAGFLASVLRGGAR